CPKITSERLLESLLATLRARSSACSASSTFLSFEGRADGALAAVPFIIVVSSRSRLLGPDGLEVTAHGGAALRRDALVGDALLGRRVVRGEDLAVRRR